MTRTRRTLIALAATALLAVFGGAVQGVATTRGEIEPGTPAAGALERLQDRLEGGREGDRVLRRMSTADCPWLRDKAS
jgi:hypothetical protein